MESIEDFLPSKNILNEIEWVEGKRFYFRGEALPDGEQREEYVKTILHPAAEAMKKFYCPRKDNPKFHLDYAAFLLKEGVKNALIHGPSGEVNCGLFLGNKGACFGFRDGGQYFKNLEIKKLWEEKDLFGILLKADPPRNWDGTGPYPGIASLFEDSEKIEVDSARGILYCTQMARRYGVGNLSPMKVEIVSDPGSGTVKMFIE
jgi:hypothetical protein